MSFLKFIVLNILFIVNTTALALNVICPKPFVIGTEYFPPFDMYNPNEIDDTLGINLKFLAQIFNTMNCSYTFIHGNWDRQLMLLENGRIDIMTSVNKTEEREKFAYFLTPYLKSQNSLFVKQDNIKNLKFKDLTTAFRFPDFKLGIIRGYQYTKEFSNLLKHKLGKSKIVTFEKNSEMINKLLEYETDLTAFLGDTIVISYLLREMKLQDLIGVFPTKETSKSNFIYFAYSKKSVPKDVSELIDNTMQKLILDGSLQKIAETYLDKNEIELTKVTLPNK